MQLQLCSVFFTFSLGTRTHYFGRTILHGGARASARTLFFMFIVQLFRYKLISPFLESSWVQYQATGRGFVVRHIKFSENYRLYSRSHFVKGFVVSDSGTLYEQVKGNAEFNISFVLRCRFEVVLLLVVFLAYGYITSSALSYILITVSSWFMALSWLFAPYSFNPSGFEWQK